jgi:aminopeptidase S
MKFAFIVLLAVCVACAPANTSSSRPPPVAPAVSNDNPIINGGFEQGETGWKWFREDGGVAVPRTGGFFRSGRTYANLSGVSSRSDRRARAFVQQTVEVPRSGKVTLVYYVRMDSQEVLGSDDDSFNAYIDGSGISRTLRTDQPRGRYTQYTFDLSDYRGKLITLKFESFNDNKADTIFSLDDVSIVVQ